MAKRKGRKQEQVVETAQVIEEGVFAATCKGYTGKGEDCGELQILRWFRDAQLKPTEEGKALVEEYYAISPSIIEKLDLAPDKQKAYAYIYGVVTVCVSFISAGNYGEATATCQNLLDDLKTRCGL